MRDAFRYFLLPNRKCGDKMEKLGAWVPDPKRVRYAVYRLSAWPQPVMAANFRRDSANQNHETKSPFMAWPSLNAAE